MCEYCDKGSLREALDLGAFTRSDGSINYPAVLDTAIEIATAVAHLHHRSVLHSDLKVCLSGRDVRGAGALGGRAFQWLSRGFQGAACCTATSRCNCRVQP